MGTIAGWIGLCLAKLDCLSTKTSEIIYRGAARVKNTVRDAAPGLGRCLGSRPLMHYLGMQSWVLSACGCAWLNCTRGSGVEACVYVNLAPMHGAFSRSIFQ